MRRRMTITDAECVRVRAFIQSLSTEHHREGYGHWYTLKHPITKAQVDESYQSWAKGGRGWRVIDEGGTGIMAAICWYQHVHKPGSREWRPSVIVRALLEASDTKSHGLSHGTSETHEGSATPSATEPTC